LIANLGIQGVWTPQAEALFDIRGTDTDATSYVDHSVAAVLASAEEVNCAMLLLPPLLFLLMGHLDMKP